MGWLIAYIITTIIFHVIYGSFLPASFLSTKMYTLTLLVSPFLLLIILGIIIEILERKGIIKPTHPNPPAEDTHAAKDESKEIHSESVQKIPSPVPPAPPEPPEPPKPRPPTVDEMLRNVDQLDGCGFERWCSQILGKIGFTNVQLTKSSGDQGVDIVAAKDDVWYAFQCKCYSSDIGNHPVQEVHAGKSLYNCHVGVVVTNRHFTSGAKELAKATGTLLWDRDKLKAVLKEIQSKTPSDVLIS